jgi:hypothetical protein
LAHDAPSSPPAPVPHAFTVDAEDWAALMCMYLGREVPVSAQFEHSIHGLLDLLDDCRTQGTFYVVASHAVQSPAVVREIVRRGHELGSHAWTHHQTRTFTPEAFREDLRRSVGALEDLTGEKVRGHRCPFFSLLPDQRWALAALAEAGLEYDSSITTRVWAAAGARVPEQPFTCRLPGGASLVEFPAPARKFGPVTVRYLGGRGLRNLPRRVCLDHLAEREREGLPAILYLHTYEVAPDRLMRYVPSGFGLTDRLKLALAARSFEIGLGHMQRTIHYILSHYRWAPAAEVLAQLRQAGHLPELRLD